MSIWGAVRFDGSYSTLILVAVVVFWPVYFAIAISSGIEGRRAKDLAYEWARNCEDPGTRRSYFGRRNQATSSDEDPTSPPGDS